MINAIKSFFKVILYQPMYNIFVFLVWLIPGHNLGWAVILLTIIIRLILYPSQKKAIVSQQQLQRIQPELDEIKTKYGKDQQAQAQATMDLYKRNNINPFASCLPLLIQLPIMFILYKVFTVGLNTDRFDMLYSFTPRPEFINTIFCWVDLSKPNIAFAIVAGVLQFFQSKMMMPPKPKVDKNKEQDAASIAANFSSQMIYMMPIMTILIAVKLPAALPLYWIVTTLFMIVQQKMLSRHKVKIDPKGVSVKVISGK